MRWPSILEYLNEAADENNLREKIQFKTKVKLHNGMLFSNLEARDRTGASDQIEDVSCNVLYLYGGYYNYDQGYLPEFEGYDDFEGTIIHPQNSRKILTIKIKVVVIGSGATAVTIVPAMADKVSKITMLQRSPTYYVSS